MENSFKQSKNSTMRDTNWFAFFKIELVILRIISFVSIFFCSSIDLIAQQNLDFKKLSAEQGVSQSIIYALAQDSIGNIWMATEEGAIRYNSRNSTNYNKYSGLPEDLGSRIQTVYIDSKNQIWIGSEDGIAIYDEGKDGFKTIPSQENIDPLLVKFFVEDAEGDIWVGCFNGLWKITQDGSISQLKRVQNLINVQTVHYIQDHILAGTASGLFQIDPITNDMEKLQGIGGDYDITDLARLDENSILIGTRESGLLKVDNRFNLIDKIDLPTGTRNFPIFDLIVDNNQVYIATDGAGLLITNIEFNEFQVYQNDENKPNSISSNGIYDIHIDRENILWIATYGGGLNFHNPRYSNFQNFHHLINDDNSLISSFVRSIAEDKYGRIWFGTKKGISIFNPEQVKWTYLPNLSPATRSNHVDIVLCLEPDEDHMWAGIYDGGAYKINIDDFSTVHFSPLELDSFPLNKIYDIHKDADGDIWFGGIDGNLTRLTQESEFINYKVNQVKNIIDGPQNSLMLAGRNGLQSLNKNSGDITTFEKTVPGNNPFEYFTINALCQLNDNTILLASSGGGLLFYDIKTEKLQSLTIDKGMPSEIVQGVLATSSDNIWASTTAGLVNIRLVENDTILRTYDRDDGLASTEFNFGSFAKLSDNRIAFGGTDGVSIFKPDIQENIGFQPQIYFEEFSIANTAVKPGEEPLNSSINVTDELELKYFQNSFGFKFVGVLHNASSKINYSWKLEGFENSWSSPSNQNSVTYTNINPGDYIFKVRAANRLGEFGPIREIKIGVATPWYLSNVAVFAYILFFVALGFLLIYITSVMVNKKNAEQQVNFYNNLTHEIRTPMTILLSSLDNYSKQNNDEEGNERIKSTLKRINSLFEQMLTYQKSTISTSKSVHPIDIEHHTRELLDDFKPLLDDRKITVEFKNSWKNELFYFSKEDYDKVIFNLLSNAIKYSFEHSQIGIKTEHDKDDYLKITITDTGMGIPRDQQKNILKRFYRARNVVNSQKPGTGLGLMLVKNIVDQTNGNISFESQENKGTVFYVRLKNRKKHFKQEALLASTNATAIHLEESGKLDEFSDSKILLVEDNEELRKELERILGKYFQVFEATNGKEGLEKSATVYPDLILTDLIMPEMDGLAMAKAIKNDINLNHIPIFMLTLLQNQNQKIESLEAGIAEYLEKPIDINLLIAKIVNALTFQKKIQKRYQEQSDLETALNFRNESDQKFIGEIESFVLERIKDENFSVHDICSKFNMSRTSLYMKLKNLVDLSPQDLIINTRLKFAKSLLLNPDMNIKEVAYESGFSNPKYFSTSFKKFYGKSPSAYINSVK